MKMQTEATARKVKGASAGAGAGGGMGAALAIIIIAVLEAQGVQVSAVVEGAAYVLGTGVVAGLGAWWIGYQTRPAVQDRIQAE